MLFHLGFLAMRQDHINFNTNSLITYGKIRTFSIALLIVKIVPFDTKSTDFRGIFQTD